MSYTKEMNQIIDLVRQAGWTAEINGKGHWKCAGPDGALVHCPKSPSDNRAFANIRAEFKRHGLDLNAVASTKGGPPGAEAEKRYQRAEERARNAREAAEAVKAREAARGPAEEPAKGHQEMVDTTWPTPRYRAVIKAIIEHGPIDWPVIADKTGLSASGIRYMTRWAERQGLIEPVGQRSGNVAPIWQATEFGREFWEETEGPLPTREPEPATSQPVEPLAAEPEVVLVDAAGAPGPSRVAILVGWLTEVGPQDTEVVDALVRLLRWAHATDAA